MAKDKNKKTNPIAGFGGKVIDLAKFNIKSDKEQYEEIKKTLEDIYQDNLKVTRKHIMKVIGLTLVPKDDYVAQVTITDGENESAPFYIYYKVV